MVDSVENLKAQIWGIFNQFRGSVSQQETVHWLTGLILFRLLAEKIEIPEYDPTSSKAISDYWNHLISTSSPDKVLAEAVEVICREYPQFAPFFESLDPHNSSLKRQHLLALINAISSLNLIGEQDQLHANTADALFSIYSDASGARGGDFYTTNDIRELLVGLVRPEPGMSVYDPACGTAGLLLTAQQYSKRIDDSKELRLFGRDINLQTGALARINTYLHSISNAAIVTGNSLLESCSDQTKEGINKFDIVVTHPPVGLRLNKSMLSRLRQESGCFPFGPTTIADFNFIQHALVSLKPDGRAAILINLGPLFRGGNERRIREQLVKSDWIEAVVTLAHGLLPQTNAQTAIILLNKNKPVEQRNQVFFVYADEEVEQPIDGRRREIAKENRSKIIETVLQKRDESKFSALVALEKIAEEDFVLLPSQYVGLRDVNIFLGGVENWREIDNLATVFQGARLGKGQKEGSVIQGRDLTVTGLSSDDLETKRLPSDLPGRLFTQVGDVLIQRIGQNPTAFLVEEGLDGIAVSDTVYVIRPHSRDLSERFLVEYLNSKAGQAHLSSCIGGAVVPTMRLTALRKLKIPNPSPIVIELIEDLHQVEETLIKQIDKARQLRRKLFSIEDPEQFSAQSRSLSVEAQVLSGSVIQADDLDFQIRNYYPFMLSFAFRSLNALSDVRQLYPEQLRVAENLLAFIGSLGLALAGWIGYLRSSNSELSEIEVEAFWEGGISPGTWQEMGLKTAKMLRNNDEYAAVESFASVWFKGRGTRQSNFAEALRTLVELKNDYKHDRGPKTIYEYEDATKKIDGILRKCMREIAFFVQYPIRLVQEIDINWRTNQAELQTLVYVGDHPGLKQERITFNKPLTKGQLFLELTEDVWVPLYPLISTHHCNSCKSLETYTIDWWNKSGAKLRLKSFERGHTHTNNDITKQVEQDLRHWIEKVYT